MPRFAHDTIELAYDDTGPGAPGSVPVVLLHGLSSSRGTWHRVTPTLRPRHRVFAVDHRGHGESSHATGTYLLDRYGADTIAFCEEIVGAPAVVVGHSLGGVIAAYVARTRPDLVAGALLEDPPLYVGEGAPRESRIASMFPTMRQIMRDMRERGASVDEYAAMVRAAPALNGAGTMGDVLGEAGIRAQAEGWAGADPEIFTPAIDGGALAGAQPEVPLACPVEVVRADPSLGAAFSSEDAERFVATNPAAVVTLFEGTSHAVHDEQPDRFNATLGAFIERVTGS